MKTALDGILLLNAETAQIEDANPFLTKLLGYSHAELLGKKLWEVGGFADTAQSKEMFAQLQADGYARYEDLPLTTRLGAQIAVEFVSNAYDCEGVRVIQCNIRDISERKKMASQLRDADAQFQVLVEQSIAGIFVIQDGRLSYVNPRWVSIMGQGPVEELIGTDPLPRIFEGDRSKVADALLQLASGTLKNVTMVIRVVRRDGVAIQAAGNAALARYQGRVAIIGLLQDVSDSKRAESKIRQYVEQLENCFAEHDRCSNHHWRDAGPVYRRSRAPRSRNRCGDRAELGFDEFRQEGLQMAGYLHDVGKIALPAEILAKPTKLNPAEYALIQGHPQASFDVLKNVEFPWAVATIALQHHERMDGTGYPERV